MRSKLFVVVFSCAVFIFSGCKERIVHDLSEYQANQIATSLDDIGLSVSKEKQGDGKWRIAVPGKSAMVALKHLSSTRVFSVKRNERATTTSVVSSREDRQFQYERALSGEIESTLRSIYGVLDARVHLNIAPTDPVFGRPLSAAHQGSASVLLISDGEISTDEEHVAQLVYGASGVPIEKISVLISTASESAPVEVRDAAVQSPQRGSQGIDSTVARATDSLSDILTARHQLAFPLLFVLVGVIVLWKLSPWR